MVNILVAEDNEAYRNLIKIHLLRGGYNVLEADDGCQALDILAHNQIHLIIADVMMPHMDGFQLTSEIRSANYSLPILIITAKSTLEDKREGFKNGADDYMTKPIDMDEMLLRVEALLRRANISEKHILTVGDCARKSFCSSTSCCPIRIRSLPARISWMRSGALIQKQIPGRSTCISNVSEKSFPIWILLKYRPSGDWDTKLS